MRRSFVALLVGALAVFAFPSVASSGAASLTVELEGPGEPLTFRLQLNGLVCDPGTFNVQTVEDGAGDPVTPISITQEGTNVAHVVLPSDTVPGEIFFAANCEFDEDPTPVVFESEFIASLAITKDVVGDAPAGTTFLVNANCVGAEIGEAAEGDFTIAEVPFNFDVDVPYPAAGGVGYVYTDHAVLCVITEPETGGAQSVTIDPELVGIPFPGQFAATVTNTFETIVVAFTG